MDLINGSDPYRGRVATTARQLGIGRSGARSGPPPPPLPASPSARPARINLEEATEAREAEGKWERGKGSNHRSFVDRPFFFLSIFSSSIHPIGRILI
ncbi:hypothetical protein MUK42_37504 [Musa troglodytarum]|uniref:Uncharacterized protein n=1 Tax=Musa troglodytarum TaxID=320322 RepID=A0A9E7JVD9_9LILI|nr:hypothetical protein MUK42_37504 [Musa troglodytarum]